MRITDLGSLAGEILLFGGPVSNLAATEAVLRVPAAARICTGDTVAYCARGAETVAAIRHAGVAVVAGNCERQIAAAAPDCGCGFEPGSVCDRLSSRWYRHAVSGLTGDDRAWMAGLPDVLRFDHAGRRWAVLHGGATDIARFLWPVSPEADFEAEWDALERVAGPVDGIVAGHCGLAFTRPLRRGPWLNAGTVGMPPNDGEAGTAYATLAPDGTPRLHRLSYDPGPEIAAMVAAGLTQGYEATLRSGYWPSEDVLPPALRAGASAASG